MSIRFASLHYVSLSCYTPFLYYIYTEMKYSQSLVIELFMVQKIIIHTEQKVLAESIIIGMKR